MSMITTAFPSKKTMPSLNIERYPTFNENLKKNPKKKNRTFSDVTYEQENTWGYERSTRTGNDLKRMRRANKQLITKSRNTKRQLKNMESGLRTPMEENDASNEADSVDFSIGMEKYEKDQDRRWFGLSGDDVFYNSDGESVLFDDMEPVQVRICIKV